MKQKIILSSIIDGIYQLENYIQAWRDNEEVPTLERDLVKRKLQEIYDEIMHLNPTLPTVESKSSITHEVKTVVQEPEIAVPGPVQELIFEKTTEITEEIKPAVHDIPLRTEPVQKVTEPVQKIVEVTVSKTETETEKPKETSKTILAERLSQPHKLINETIKARTVMDVSSKLKSSPITSIQSAINLNDKFLFIRELFKNNNLLYNQTIERLNNAKNYEEAVSIIEKEFAWDMNEALVLKLVELVKRKHNA